MRVTITTMIMTDGTRSVYGVFRNAPVRTRKGRIVSVNIGRADHVASYEYIGERPDYLALAKKHETLLSPAFVF